SIPFRRTIRKKVYVFAASSSIKYTFLPLTPRWVAHGRAAGAPRRAPRTRGAQPRSAILALSRTEMVALRLSVPSSRQIRDPGAGQTGQNGQLPSPSGCGYTVRGVIVEPSRSGLSRDFDHIWWWRTRLPERKGQRCRILVRAK